MSDPAKTLNPAAATAVIEDNPWPGLLPFQETDSSRFKGRQAEAEELLRLVMRERLSVLFGVSGLGKSSLLQAGLFPALRNENVFPVYIRLDFSPQEPDLIAQIRQAIHVQAVAWEIEAPPFQEKDTLWEHFHRHDSDFWNKRNRPVVPLLVFDQFEEIFTLGRRDESRVRATQIFLQQLADLAEGSVPAVLDARLDQHPEEADLFAFGKHRYKLLIGIREDFLPDLEGLRSRISAIALNRLRLRRMNGESAMLAVNQAPHLIDRDVAEKVVFFLAACTRPGIPLADLEVEPALLSVVCRELNQKRRARGEPKITAVLLEGNQEEVLSDFYEGSFVDIPAAVRSFIEDHLLTVSGYRDSVALENALNAPGITRNAIDHLVERRLVRIEDRGGQRLELTHDLLVKVVRVSRDRRHGLEDREREAAKRKEAEEKYGQALRQLRRSRLIAAALLVLFVAAVGAAVWAVRAQKDALHAQNEAQNALERAETSAKQERDAKLYAIRAQEESKELRVIAVAEKGKAVEQADAATKAKLVAEDKRQEAIKATQAAERAKGDADTARKRAEDLSKSEAASADNAKREAQRALLASREAEQLRGRADLAAKAAQKELAQSLVQEAEHFVDIQEPQKAMAYLAKALQQDPDSMAARSWVFDRLLRANWDLPGEPLPPPGTLYLLVHQPIAHSKRVLFGAFSPDGRRVATAVWDNAALIRDWESDKPPIEIRQPQVTLVAFSPDGRLLVTAARDNTAQVWDAATGSRIGRPLTHRSPVNSAVFSPDNLQVMTASLDKNVQVWDARTGDPQGPPLAHDLPVDYAAFSPVGRRVVTASWDGKARVWDLDSRKQVLEVRHRGEVHSAVFSADGRWLVTASEDKTAQIWDSSTGKPLSDPLRHSAAVYYAAFSPDGRRVVTASADRTARVWEAATGRPVGAPLVHNNRVNSAVFSPDGRRVLTASDDNTARIWEVWYDFDDVAPLSRLAEAASGYQADKVPELLPMEAAARTKLLGDLRKQSLSPGPGQSKTATLLQWFFSRTNSK